MYIVIEHPINYNIIIVEQDSVKYLSFIWERKIIIIFIIQGRVTGITNFPQNANDRT